MFHAFFGACLRLLGCGRGVQYDAGGWYRGGGLALRRPCNPTQHTNRPTCSCRGFRNGKAAYQRGVVKESNFRGNGSVLGGLLIFQKGGELVYRHAETDYGVHPPMSDVIHGAERAAPAVPVAA